MQKITNLLLIGLLFFSNINAKSIKKKNYLGLSSQKGILSHIKNNIEISKEQNDKYTKYSFVIYHDKPLKDKSKQQINQIAKSIADYLMEEEDEATQQLPQQQQVPQQAVDDAVEQLQQLADQDTKVPQQAVQQILQDAAQQLPQQQAQQIQEMIDAVQEQKDDLTPQQVQQIVDELQNNCPDLSELKNAVNDILSKVLDVTKTLENKKDIFDKFADNSQVLNTNTANEFDVFKSILDELDNKLNKLLENVLNAAVTCPFVNDDVQQLQQKVDEVQALIQLYKHH